MAKIIAITIDADAQGSLTASLGYHQPDKLPVKIHRFYSFIRNNNLQIIFTRYIFLSEIIKNKVYFYLLEHYPFIIYNNC